MAHILVIEDDTPLCAVIARMLRLDGHEVTQAADGRSGLECWGVGGEDVVITDLHMGDMDGIEVVLQLRALAPALPIIVMSGSAVSSDAERLLEAQLQAGVTVIQKPFSFDTLVATVRSALADQRQREA